MEDNLSTFHREDDALDRELNSLVREMEHEEAAGRAVIEPRSRVECFSPQNNQRSFVYGHARAWFDSSKREVKRRAYALLGVSPNFASEPLDDLLRGGESDAATRNSPPMKSCERLKNSGSVGRIESLAVVGDGDPPKLPVLICSNQYARALCAAVLDCVSQEVLKDDDHLTAICLNGG